MTTRERWVSVSTPLTLAFDDAVELLTSDPRLLVGDRFELSVDTEGGSSLRQVVDVRLGAPCRAEGEGWIPIAWQPAGHSRVLPSFDGVIEVVEGVEGVEGDDGTRLSITGTYGIPLGFLGRFGDGLVGRRVAVASLQRAVVAMAARLEDRAPPGDLGSWGPATYAEDLRDGRCLGQR